MRHAYLIMAHNDWDQLERLIELLDSKNADIYVHIDKRATLFPKYYFEKICKYSKISFFSKYKNYWGGFSLVQSEIFLLREASRFNYDYYHLLSGSDLPIKPIKKIEAFFEANDGKEFIHFDTDKRLEIDKEIWRRTALYHFLQNYRKISKMTWLNKVFTFIEHILLGIQLVFNVDRLKKKNVKIYYGSQWFSITHAFTQYVLSNQDKIDKLFRYTSCSDELLMQTLIMESPYKDNLYIRVRGNFNEANMRLIDWQRGKNGSPYTWKHIDYEILKCTKCLFARKFNSGFSEEIIKLLSYEKERKEDLLY